MSKLIYAINYLTAYVQSGRKDRGASAVEYAIVVALIATFVISIVTVLGGQVFGLFETACARINGGTACALP